jgi:hypothetical protein
MPGLIPERVHRRYELLPRFTAYYTQLRALPRRVRRALQRQWRLPLAGVALLLALGQRPGLAAMIPVGGACTLVDAITAANTDTATGGCPAGSGADTILLPAGSTQTLTEVNNSTYGPTGLPVISSVITIAGQGSTIARDPEAPEFRLMAVDSLGNLTLQETTVSGGLSSTYNGGGVANYGTLTVMHSTIASNTAVSYCPYEIGCYGGRGGGVHSSGPLTVTTSTITGNVAAYGGGVHSSGPLTVTTSTITGNTTYGRVLIAGGGGVYSSGPCTVTTSTIMGNAASYGGGVVNRGPCVVTTSTIVGNSTFGGVGGGVVNAGTLTVRTSTITGNTAAASGGGVVNDGTLTMLNSTITGNVAEDGVGVVGGGVWNAFSYGTLTLARTLVSGNTATTGPEIANDGTVLADNHNLFGVDGTAGVEGFTPGATDIVPPAGTQLADILNPTLAFNGGPTQTHALVPGSPAIDAGGTDCADATGDSLATDQRGRPRVVDGNSDGIPACDIGAVEFFPMVNALVALAGDVDTAFDPTPVVGGPAGTFTITATFTNTSDTPLRFPFFGVNQLTGDNLVLNADGAPGGVGASVTLEVAGDVLAPGASVTAKFVIGLQTPKHFTFFVNLFGEPVH